MFSKGDLVKITQADHSRFGHTGLFIEEFTVPNTKLERPLYKVLIDGEVRLMLISELARVS